jgi:hypothetical protein
MALKVSLPDYNIRGMVSIYRDRVEIRLTPPNLHRIVLLLDLLESPFDIVFRFDRDKELQKLAKIRRLKLVKS